MAVDGCGRVSTDLVGLVRMWVDFDGFGWIRWIRINLDRSECIFKDFEQISTDLNGFRWIRIDFDGAGWTLTDVDGFRWLCTDF